MRKDFFENKVITEDGCWNWTKSRISNKYGKFSIGKKNIYAHRHAWFLVNGEIPDGLFVCHKCDNMLCINPDHLFLGTAQDNARDRTLKNRNNNKRKVFPENETSKSKELISFRSSCRKLLDAEADEKRLTRSEVIDNIIRQYYNK
jgi:hypothetical protein